jgi:hypothetical protein
LHLRFELVVAAQLQRAGALSRIRSDTPDFDCQWGEHQFGVEVTTRARDEVGAAWSRSRFSLSTDARTQIPGAGFADTIPSLRIAVDLKVELLRNAAKPWTMNAIHDIDALSMAVPYCHVVVPDREMASLLSCSGTAPRNGTKIIITLSELPDALLELAEQARNAPETEPAATGQDNGTATASTWTTCSRAADRAVCSPTFNLKRQNGKRLV